METFYQFFFCLFMTFYKPIKNTEKNHYKKKKKVITN